MFTSISTQTHEESEDAKRLACLCGVWEPAKGECLPIDRVISIRETFLSADACPLNLCEDMRSVMKNIDVDGDAVIYFPCVRISGIYNNVAIFKHDFNKLSLLSV